MSPAQRVNCRAGKLATVTLIVTVEANEFISSISPLKKACVEIAGERVMGSSKMGSLRSRENKWRRHCMTDGGW
jgi:hypothetical protein